MLNPGEGLQMICLLVFHEHVKRPPPGLGVERMVNLRTGEEKWLFCKLLVRSHDRKVKKLVLLRFRKWCSLRKAG